MKNITIRTTHALCAADLSALYQYTKCLRVIPVSTEYWTNNPPLFPLLRSYRENYVLVFTPETPDEYIKQTAAALPNWKGIAAANATAEPTNRIATKLYNIAKAIYGNTTPA